MEKIYYLVRFDTLDINQDFNAFLSYLTFPDISVSHGGNQATLTYLKTNFQAVFKKIQAKSPFSQASPFLIQCQPGDYQTLNIFREIAPKVKYRVFDPSLGCFLPQNPRLLTNAQVILNEKHSQIFKARGLNPVFTLYKTSLFFAQPFNQPAVHIVNPSLLEYFFQFGVDSSPTNEFSYEVAPNLIEFSALHDQGLISHSFYWFYQKPLKIINYSDFDLDHLDRKVFIKPWFFVYNQDRQEYSLLTSEKSALSLADKIRPGENLDSAVKRILKEETKMADDYFRIKVTKVEFDKDKEGVLTPRLWVSIYLKQAKLEASTIQKAQQGWVSNQTLEEKSS